MPKATTDDGRDPDLVAVQEGPAAAGELTQPAGLDRRKILSAALNFIDENGLSALTMRRLGNALGFEAMALYRYVPGREGPTGRGRRAGGGETLVPR